MYEYIKGKYMGFLKDYAIVDNNGIGYKIYISGSTLTKLPQINDDVQLFTHQIVREDFIGLYGFISREELELFLMLININGVGAKAALSLLSILEVDKLKYAIAKEDEKTLTRAPGIGKKMAQRIILELKDKLKHAAEIEEEGVTESAIQNNNFNDALEALLTLGYTEKECRTVLNTINMTDSLENIIKKSLGHLMR